jgi:tetratricopeptide (TPR) repeat protein
MESFNRSSLSPGESPDDRLAAAGRLFQRAEDLRGRGEAATALEPYRSALDAFREVGDDLRAAETRYRIAWIDGRLGRRTAAAALKAAAEDLGRHVRPERRLSALERGGGLLLGTGDARGAVDLLRSAAAEAEAGGDDARTAHVLARLGEAHHLLGETEDAVAAYDRALDALGRLEVSDPAERCRLSMLAAAAERSLGDLNAVRDRLETVVDLRASTELPALLAEMEEIESARDALDTETPALDGDPERADRIERARDALRLALHHHLLAWARGRPLSLERSRRRLDAALADLGAAH